MGRRNRRIKSKERHGVAQTRRDLREAEMPTVIETYQADVGMICGRLDVEAHYVSQRHKANSTFPGSLVCGRVEPPWQSAIFHLNEFALLAGKPNP